MPESIRHIYGVVADSGTPITQHGFSVTQSQPGLYDIQFTTAFSEIPAMSATQVFPNELNNPGGSTNDNAVIVFIRKDSCRIKTGASDGNPQSRDFTFIAAGN